MTHWKVALSWAALAGLGLIGIACLPGGGSGDTTTPTPSPTRQADIQAVRTTIVASPTPTPFPTVLPALPLLSTYTVQSGDYPTLIAELAGVPAAERDAWIGEMLALNGTDAHSLQIGQELILPPLSNGAQPVVDEANRPEPDSDPPASLVEPAQPIPGATGTQTAGNGSLVPFAPTPPFVAFVTQTPTPSPTPSASATATPFPADQHVWFTSSAQGALYYYCDQDTGWLDIASENLQVFESEQALLAVWGRVRVIVPGSAC